MTALSARLRPLLQRAIERRRLPPDTTVYRLFHGEGEGAPELTLDWFDGLAVLSLYQPLTPGEEAELAQLVVELARPDALYLKRRPREARQVATTQKEALAPEAPLWGPAISERVVLEGGLRFSIRPAQGLSVGLYLDAREARRLVRQLSAGKTLLNCFAYTCGFGVAALAGGAAGVVNVDVSRKVLDWGAENARLNAQSMTYRAEDVFEALKRLAKKDQRFDQVLLDPPSFASTRARRFSAARDYPELVRDAARVVAPGGTLIACCNLASLTPARFEAQVARGLAEAGRSGRLRQALSASPLDFPAPPGESAALKVLVLQLDSSRP